MQLYSTLSKSVMFCNDKIRLIIYSFIFIHLCQVWREKLPGFCTITGENLHAVTAVTDSFEMAEAFAGDRTDGAVAQTSAQTVDISVRLGIVWVYRLQRMYGSGCRLFRELNRRMLMREMLQ